MELVSSRERNANCLCGNDTKIMLSRLDTQSCVFYSLMEHFTTISSMYLELSTTPTDNDT